MNPVHPVATGSFCIISFGIICGMGACHRPPVGALPCPNFDVEAAGQLTGDAAACWVNSTGGIANAEDCPLAWRAESDLLLGGGPVTYELSADGTLSAARLVFDGEFLIDYFVHSFPEDDDGFDSVPPPELVSLTDHVTLGNSTLIAGMLRNGVLSEGYELNYETFEVEFGSDGSVVWTFSQYLLLKELPVDFPAFGIVAEGTIYGGLSEDGQSILWTCAEATSGNFSFATADSVDLSDLVGHGRTSDPIGLWTLVNKPEVLPDVDADGVSDPFDLCPDTLDPATVDLLGCADAQRDTDMDDVTDDLDICPYSVTDAEVDDEGCAFEERDSDEDGVVEPDDLCDDTPEEDLVDETGCTVTTPGPVAQVWASELPLVFRSLDVIFSPISLEFTEDGQLVSVGLGTAGKDDESSSTLVIEQLSESAPFTVTVDLFRSTDLGFVFLVQGRVDEGILTFPSDGEVVWDFDVVVITYFPPVLGFARTPSYERYVGSVTGDLSDNEQTITWTAISGTRTYTQDLNGDGTYETPSTESLEEDFSELLPSDWTRVE